MQSNPENIVEIRPCSLVGAAKFVRDWYIRGSIMTKDQTLILTDPSTGERNIAGPISDEDRIKKRLEKAQTDFQKKSIAKSKRAQKEAKRKRDWRKRKNITDPPILAKIWRYGTTTYAGRFLEIVFGYEKISKFR